MIAADIERIARRGTIAVSMLAAEVYRNRPTPRDPEACVKTILCRIRRERGVPVHLHQGHVTIGIRPASMPIIAGPWACQKGRPFSTLEAHVLGVLREYDGVPLTAREIADEIGYLSDSSKLCAIMRRLVAKGISIDRVGRGYRLARCHP